MSHTDNSEKPDFSLKAQVMAFSCASGSCPTVYSTNRGTVLVQGYTVSADAAAGAGVTLPEGEQLVEIPADLLAQALAAQTASGDPAG